MRIIALFSAVLTVALFSSCRGTRDIILPDSTQTDRIVTVTIRDTVFTTVPDSSSFSAQLIVSPDGKISLGQRTVDAGKYMRSPEVNIRDNKLQVDCYAEAQRLFHQWKETEIKESRQTVRTIVKPPKIVEKPLNLWQKIQIWLGRIFLILLAIYGLSLFIFHRLNKNIFNG